MYPVPMDRFYVYLMANQYNNVLYTGVTKQLKQRVLEHKSGLHGFTAKYKISKLVYYQDYATVDLGIAEEKRIKGGSRKKKTQLIEDMNPTWRDLTEDLKQ